MAADLHAADRPAGALNRRHARELRTLGRAAAKPADDPAALDTARRALRWLAANRRRLGLTFEEQWVCVLGRARGAGPSARAWHWRFLETLAAAEDADDVYWRFGAQPDRSSEAAEAFYGTGFCESNFDPRRAAAYPRRLIDQANSCECLECNTPAKTHSFVDPRGTCPRHISEAFCEEDRQAFFDRFPRALLEWSLDAWRHEARFDGLCLDVDAGGWEPGSGTEILARRRAMLICDAECSLRWRSPGRDCRAAWAGAVARATAAFRARPDPDKARSEEV